MMRWLRRLLRGERGGWVGGGTYKGSQLLTPALTPAAVGANTTAEQSFVVAALAPAPAVTPLAQIAVIVTKPTAQAGLGIVGARVIDATHIGITFANVTAAPITPTAGEVYAIMLLW